MSIRTEESGNSLGRVLADLRKGRPAPCYLLYGDAEYEIRDAFSKIVDLLLPPEDQALNLFIVDGEDEDPEQIGKNLLTLPLLPGRKIVAVRRTRLFHSRKTLNDLVKRIREQMNAQPQQAAKNFMTFLGIAGWNLDDFREDGWKSISNQDWQQAVEGDSGEDRIKWLPRVIEICIGLGLSGKSSAVSEADFLENILRSGLPEGNVLLLTAETVDKRKKLFKAINELGKVLTFQVEKGETRQKNTLMDSARTFLAEKGKGMASGAWDVLGRKTGFQLRTSMAALEKLVTYTGERKTIEASDVEEVVSRTREDKLFDLTAALGDKNLEKGLAVLRSLKDQGIHPLVVLAMLVREMRLLLHARWLRDQGALTGYSPRMDYGRYSKQVYPTVKAWGGQGGEVHIELADQHPYVVFNILRNSENFSEKRLRRHLEDLLVMDLAMKSTARDPDRMLERFLLDICQP
ncbi:DNA polymerase III, delta subunit [Syntrophus gentianae]|uniref:DNA polymerase III subunit delta n=1 Tax=Syntrophus gentianae TaxID=43775 RepID=A0A1H7UEU6_9BACT|nr:DNA polymerase III, delta subunit [Syntrophus gentianae]